VTAPIVGAAKVGSDGKVIALGPRSSPNDAVSIDDVQDKTKLARLLGKLSDIAAMLVARWYPRRLDFEDVATPGAGTIPLQHNFNGRVRWWVVDWSDSGGTRHSLTKDTVNTTANTLVLSSLVVGIATIRVEEAG
jgi:hypothetical protein